MSNVAHWNTESFTKCFMTVCFLKHHKGFNSILSISRFIQIPIDC